MSTKKVFALVCLFIFISWGIVSIYYYNKHVVTIKEHKVGERIEVSEGIVMVHSIEIRDFERRHRFYSDRFEWFYNSVLPKLPVKLQMTAMRSVAFYSERYNFDLGIDDIEGRIMYVNGIYVSKGEGDKFLHDKINVGVAAENGVSLTGRGGGSSGAENSNIRMFHSRGKFFFNEYSPTGDDILTIYVTDKLSDERHEINIEADWETKKYNFFNGPPADYSFSPDQAFNRFIRVAVYEKDLNTAEEYIHPQISDFPWENLDHDKWVKRHGTITLYEGEYLGFNDVFSTRITFGDFEDEESEAIFEQRVFLVDYDGEWKIIGASPLTINNS